MGKIKSTRISPMSGELVIKPFRSKTPSYEPEPEPANKVRPNTTIVPNKCCKTCCDCDKDAPDEPKE